MRRNYHIAERQSLFSRALFRAYGMGLPADSALRVWVEPVRLPGAGFTIWTKKEDFLTGSENKRAFSATRGQGEPGTGAIHANATLGGVGKPWPVQQPDNSASSLNTPRGLARGFLLTSLALASGSGLDPGRLFEGALSGDGVLDEESDQAGTIEALGSGEGIELSDETLIDPKTDVPFTRLTAVSHKRAKAHI